MIHLFTAPFPLLLLALVVGAVIAAHIIEKR